MVDFLKALVELFFNLVELFFALLTTAAGCVSFILILVVGGFFLSVIGAVFVFIFSLIGVL